jgi:uncharacterized protein (DUF697 family)
VPSIPTVRPFTASPLPWNTFTALDVPLIDGGTVLLVPIVALIGLIMGWIWGRARRASLAATVIYAVEAVGVVTAAGSFNFLATFLLGSIVIAVVALRCAGALEKLSWSSAKLQLRRRHREAAVDR